MALEDTQAPETTTPEAQPPAEPAVPSGPWQQDIEQSFNDPQVRATVDAFLRSKIQPRMTQLEQQIAQASEAQQLWDAFQGDPIGTYQAIENELRQAGYEVGASEDAPDAPAAPTTFAESPNAVTASDPRFEEMYAAWQEQRELESYDAEVAEILADPANQDINPELYHNFVSAADGDFDVAVNMYREDAARRDAASLDRLGITPEQLAELQAAKREQAPPTIDGDGGAGAVPTIPERKGVRGLEEAVDDVFAKLNAAAPPVIG